MGHDPHRRLELDQVPSLRARMQPVHAEPEAREAASRFGKQNGTRGVGEVHERDLVSGDRSVEHLDLMTGELRVLIGDREMGPNRLQAET